MVIVLETFMQGLKQGIIWDTCPLLSFTKNFLRVLFAIVVWVHYTCDNTFRIKNNFTKD